MKDYFETITKNYGNNFANGRFVRNIYEEMTLLQAKRLSKKIDFTTKELEELKRSDIPSYILNKM